MLSQNLTPKFLIEDLAKVARASRVYYHQRKRGFLFSLRWRKLLAIQLLVALHNHVKLFSIIKVLVSICIAILLHSMLLLHTDTIIIIMMIMIITSSDSCTWSNR